MTRFLLSIQCPVAEQTMVLPVLEQLRNDVGKIVGDDNPDHVVVCEENILALVVTVVLYGGAWQYQFGEGFMPTQSCVSGAVLHALPTAKVSFL